MLIAPNLWLLLMKTKPFPTLIPSLRSPYEEVGGIVHFGRMLDKIRLHQAAKLPADWVEAMGSTKGLDGRCCRFLHVEYSVLKAEALRGGRDDDILAWALAKGRRPSEDEIEVWNGFMTKLGWRDKITERVHFRLEEVGQPIGVVVTMFDFIDLDEGRPVRFPPT